MAFTIVTDSSCNLPNEIITRYGIKVIPLLFSLNDKPYQNGFSDAISDQEFYNALRNKATITTSGVTPQSCITIFEDELSKGHDILYIGFSSGLSSTYQTASMLLQELVADHPNCHARSIDSLAAALGQGLLVTYAAKLRERGCTLDETAAWLAEHRLQLCHWFTVDDLFFLFRGGRLSRTSALLGSLIGVKPILHVNETGHLVMSRKVRGRKAALDALVEKVAGITDNPTYHLVYISHGDCLHDAEYVRDCISKKYGLNDCVISCLEPVIGGHSGPGTLSLFFLGTPR